MPATPLVAAIITNKKWPGRGVIDLSADFPSNATLTSVEITGPSVPARKGGEVVTVFHGSTYAWVATPAGSITIENGGNVIIQRQTVEITDPALAATWLDDTPLTILAYALLSA